MVIVALTLVLGVVIGFSVSTPLWLATSLFLFVTLLYLYTHSSLLPLLSIFVAGVMISTLHTADTPTGDADNQRFGSKINHYAAAKIDKLSLSEDSKSLIGAITIGRREGMSSELKSAYRHCGASHLLAISGLHIGVVALLFGLLLRPIVLLPYGNIVINMMIVILLWLYSAIVGFTPSVVRATVMFTVLILSRLTTGSYNPLRSLAIAVVVMVAVNPAIIFSIGFQLSVVAVLSIIAIAAPIIKWIGGIYNGGIYMKVVKFIMALFIIGFVCSLTTMPLSYYYFGYFAWWGWILSPLLVIVSYLIISISMVWLLLGFDAIAYPFTISLEALCTLQNDLLLYCAQNF